MQHNSLDSLHSRACQLLKMMICKGADGGGLDRNITFKAYAQDTGLQTKASSKAELSPSTEASITPVSPPFKTRAWNDGGVVPGTPLMAPTPEAATQDAFTPVPGTVKSKIHAFTTLARPDSPRPLQTVTPVPTQSAAIDPGSDGEARVVYMPATGLWLMLARHTPCPLQWNRCEFLTQDARQHTSSSHWRCDASGRILQGLRCHWYLS